MRTALALGFVVAGVILLVMGFPASDSLACDFSRFFTGSPTDRSIWLLVGGGVCTAVGLGLLVLPAQFLRKQG